MSKESLLALAAVREADVLLDGHKFKVREVSAADFALFGELGGAGDKARATAHLIAVGVVDDEGNPLLNAEEALAVAKTARVAMPLVNKIMELSGFSGKEDEEEKHADAG